MVALGATLTSCGPTAGPPATETRASGPHSSAVPNPTSSPTPVPSAGGTVVDPTPSSTRRLTLQQAIGQIRASVADHLGTPVAWRGDIEMRLQGAVVGTRSAAELATVDGWQVCPAGATSFREAECPVSALAAVQWALRDGATLITSDVAPTRLACTRTVPPTPGPDERLVSLQPSNATCVSAFALTVILEADGRVRLVDLTLDGP